MAAAIRYSHQHLSWSLEPRCLRCSSEEHQESACSLFVKGATTESPVVTAHLSFASMLTQDQKVEITDLQAFAMNAINEAMMKAEAAWNTKVQSLEQQHRQRERELPQSW